MSNYALPTVAPNLKFSDEGQMIAYRASRAYKYNAIHQHNFMPGWDSWRFLENLNIVFHQHRLKVELGYTVPKMRHVQPDSTNCHPAGACDGWATPTTVAKNTARGAQYTNTSWFEWAHHARLLSQTHFHTANGCSVQKLQNYCTVGTA